MAESFEVQEWQDMRWGAAEVGLGMRWAEIDVRPVEGAVDVTIEPLDNRYDDVVALSARLTPEQARQMAAILVMFAAEAESE